METHSPADETGSRAVLEGQLRECFGRVVYSHKTHEKCSDILVSRLSVIKKWQIALSALTTTGFIATFFGSGHIGAAVGVVLSTLLLSLNVYLKNYDLGEVAQKHKQSANEIWFIRERYLSLLTDLAMEIRPLEEIVDERDRLLESLHSVYSGSPSTTFEAYRKAQDALQTREDLTFSSEEINSFLPAALKRS